MISPINSSPPPLENYFHIQEPLFYFTFQNRYFTLCFLLRFSITDHRHPLPEPYESMMSAHRSQVTETTDATVESSNAIERKEPVLVGSTGAPTLRSVEASGVLTLGKGTDEKRSEILTSKTVERQQVNSKTVSSQRVFF